MNNDAGYTQRLVTQAAETRQALKHYYDDDDEYYDDDE